MREKKLQIQQKLAEQSDKKKKKLAKSNLLNTKVKELKKIDISKAAKLRGLKNTFSSKAASAKKEKEPTSVRMISRKENPFLTKKLKKEEKTTTVTITPLTENLPTKTKKPMINVALQQIEATQLLQKKYQADENKIYELKKFIHKEAKRGAAPKYIIADLVQEGWDVKVVRPYVIAHYR